MASRSRTNEFTTLRDRLRGNRRTAREMTGYRGDKVLLRPAASHDNDDGSSVENVCAITVAPTYMAVVDAINEDIAQLQSKVSELGQVHGRHLLPGFNDEEDHAEKIQRMTSELTGMFKRCERRMQELKQTMGQGDASDDVVRQNILATSAQQLQELHFQFRRQQKAYLNRLRGQQAPDGVDVGDVSLATIASDAQSLLDPRFDAMQMQQLESNERAIAERNRAVEQIMTSVKDLQDIFKEIHVLVIDQGTVLDRIDYNIEKTRDKIHGAVGELVSAQKAQERDRVMLCIYLLLLLCGAMLVILIAKKSLMRKS